MHSQLQEIVDEFNAAEERLRELSRETPAEFWSRRSDPQRWSVAECVAHLNLTTAAYLPLLRDAIEHGRRMGVSASQRYRRDPLGWVLWKLMAPPVRMKVKTTAPFIPVQMSSREDMVKEFERLQVEQVRSVREAEGLPLSRIYVPSPFNQNVKYNLYACLTILPLHQHRHLWQAEQTLASLSNDASVFHSR
jgi:hypothetical protein